MKTTRLLTLNFTKICFICHVFLKMLSQRRGNPWVLSQGWTRGIWIIPAAVGGLSCKFLSALNWVSAECHLGHFNLFYCWLQEFQRGMASSQVKELFKDLTPGCKACLYFYFNLQTNFTVWKAPLRKYSGRLAGTTLS